MSNAKQTAATTSQDDEWESTKGSGSSWNPKQDDEGIMYAPAERVYDATKQPNHAEKDILVGYYIDKRDGIGQYNSSVITVVEKSTGTKKDVWLDTVLAKELDKVPSMNILVKLEWLGTKLKKDKKEGQKGATFNAWDVKYNSKDVYQGGAPVPNVASEAQQSKSVPESTPAKPAPVKGAKMNVDEVSGEDTDDLPF
jgi:hypothetical protein